MQIQPTFNFVQIAALFTVMSALSNPAIAGECANAENTVAIVDCYAARYSAADKELNAVYNEAMKSLPESGKKKFKDAQKAWLKYRDASFAFIGEANKDAGSYGGVVVADYKAKLVEKRVLELKFVLSGPEDSPVEW